MITGCCHSNGGRRFVEFCHQRAITTDDDGL